MPTYRNDTAYRVYGLDSNLLVAGSEFFRPGQTVETMELLDDKDGVMRTADTPYAHEPRTIAADATMTPWIMTRKGDHTLTLAGDWQGTVTIERAVSAAGENATRIGVVRSSDDEHGITVELERDAYIRYGFAAGGYTSGTLVCNMEEGL